MLEALDPEIYKNFIFKIKNMVLKRIFKVNREMCVGCLNMQKKIVSLYKIKFERVINTKFLQI